MSLYEVTVEVTEMVTYHIDGIDQEDAEKHYPNGYVVDVQRLTATVLGAKEVEE